MTRRAPTLLLALAAALTAAAPAAAGGPDRAPALEGRALLGADATAPAPFPGIPNTEPAPAPGSAQPIGGFSALVDAPGKDTFWAMPDNGFGSKANSRSFLLRVYKVRADFETRRGGRGTVQVLDRITLRDPARKVPFAIVNEGTSDRLLTGGDLDLESLRQDHRGDLWFGEEFGPFIVHTDATGKVLEAPIPLPGVKSPDYPADYPAPVAGDANLARSNGFEAMALSPDGRTLTPILEGPVAGDDPLVRRAYRFDIATRRYVARRPDYRVADASLLVSDATALDADRLVTLERDNFQGAAAAHKRGFVVDLRRGSADGSLGKRQAFDLLNLADPFRISLPAQPGDIGLGDPFAMPYVTIEAVLPLGGDRLAIVNDTNFGSTGRNPGRPDDSDFIEISVPGLRRGAGGPPLTLAVIGDTPYGDEQEAAFPALVDRVDGDREVRGVLHLGDIKNGSSTCTDERFARLRDLYDTFDDPFVLTPGDNDWTDCHRANNGAFIPTERLDALRRVFYPQPGRSLGGRPIGLATQARDPEHAAYVENTRFTREGVVFAQVHVVGSNNDLLPWFGAAETAEQRATRLAEFAARQAAGVDWIDAAFDDAVRRRAPGVVISMQADTFFPGGATDGFQATIERLAQRARAFGRPVLLLQGDTHRFTSDRPLATGSAAYGIADAVPNLRRVVVEGENAVEWLRLTVDPGTPEVFAVGRERVP